MRFEGTFEVAMQGEPPYEVVEGVSLSRLRFDKKFSGPLAATSQVQALAARTPRESSAGYVAIERIEGTLEGRSGTFVVVHLGLMNRGANELRVAIVADSGTGALRGIAGSMEIEVAEGEHRYALDCTFDERP